jgi:hypothetical protein
MQGRRNAAAAGMVFLQRSGNTLGRQGAARIKSSKSSRLILGGVDFFKV